MRIPSILILPIFLTICYHARAQQLEEYVSSQTKSVHITERQCSKAGKRAVKKCDKLTARVRKTTDSYLGIYEKAEDAMLHKICNFDERHAESLLNTGLYAHRRMNGTLERKANEPLHQYLPEFDSLQLATKYLEQTSKSQDTVCTCKEMGDLKAAQQRLKAELKHSELVREHISERVAYAVTMDNLAYTYTAGSNKVQKINDSATLTTWANKYSHFVDGSNATTEYTYDASGRMTTDLNKGVTYSYTAQGLVQTATMGSNTITFIWDAAGRKLAKKINTTTIINYMGGIEYTNDVLTHIATPEGIARLSDSTWVYDYYLKDHLGNVRAVITSEGAEIKEEKATMELYRRELENLSFDNIEETGTNTPPGYPYDPYDPDNRLVSSLSSSLGEVIGPAKLMTVKNGTKLDLDAQYWYTEYPGDPLDDITQILAGVLINLGNISTGVFTPGSEEGMDLLNNVTTPQFAALYDFIEGSFDNVNLSNPQAYLVYVYFDMDDMMLMKQYSGIIQVGDPDELAKLEHIDMKPHKDGFLYTYVTNRSVGKVNFDNLRVRYWKPKVRVQYDYYPYGLPWENPAVPSQGQEGLHDYLYQDKEFQFSEFSDGSGLALYDFHARMYDPATATWSVPDPAGQFSNPYLAMGNNPVSMVDPTGEVALWDDAIVAGAGFAIGYVGYGIKNGEWGGKAFAAGGIGAGVALLSYYTAGGFSLAAGGTVAGGANFAAGYAISSAVNSFMPSIPIYQSDNFNLSVSPMIGIGSSGLNFGANLNVSGQIGNWSYAGGVGVGYNSGVSSLGDAAGGSRYWNAGGFLGYTHNNTLYGGGYSFNRFYGKTGQGVGAAHLQIGGFSMRFDEDYFGDGEDRYRTGGLLMTYKVNNDLTLAFGGSMMTGMANEKMRWNYGNQNPFGDGGVAGTYDNCGEDLYNLRGGTMYGGVIYKGQSYFYGHNSEKRLHAIQNAIHRNWPIRTSPYFEDRMFGSRSYSYYGSYHPFYLFY